MEREGGRASGKGPSGAAERNVYQERSIQRRQECCPWREDHAWPGGCRRLGRPLTLGRQELLHDTFYLR